ncbi:ABC transporter permease [Arthrobacter sp. NPDC093139]|uniref:ABC transporter permease n=1 Tax=Arthrobacter sp. NPDC093139 TaxID=3363945 RepID=UPI00380D6240
MPSKFLSDSAPDAAPALPVEPAEAPLAEPAETPASESGESTKIHAALTRSSTGSADLRELESGLDSLQSDAVRKARIDWSRILLPIAALVVLVIIWQFYVSLGLKRRDQVPGPMDVLEQFGALWAEGSLLEAVWTSLQRGLLGFLISVVIATPIGLLLAQVAPLRRAFGPLISGLQVLPSVAWVPAAIIWFGLTDATVYFVVFMGAIPSIINGLISGVDQIPPQYRSVGTVLGASRLQMAVQIILPAALPGYLSGLKQGWAFSWRSLMAAEIIAVGGTIGFGLGSMLNQGRDLADMTIVMSAILLILAVGILIELLVFGPIEKRLLRRRGLLAGSTR